MEIVQRRENWEKAVGSGRGQGRGWGMKMQIKRESLKRKKGRGVRSPRGGSSFAQPLLKVRGHCPHLNPQIAKF